MTCGIFLGHLGLGDQVLLLPAIYYLATTRGYSKLYVIVKKIYLETIKALLNIEDMKTEICLLPISATTNLSDEVTEILTVMKTIGTICQKITVHASGHFNTEIKDSSDFPICFYRQLGINWEAASTHFCIPSTPKSHQLASLLTHIPYIFIHDISSTAEVGPALNDVIKKQRDKYFLINPEKNMYPTDHVFYTLAEQFVRQSSGLTLIDYKAVIENAAELHMITSCYFCFAAGLLGVNAKVKVAYSRNGDRFPTIARDWTYVDI